MDDYNKENEEKKELIANTFMKHFKAEGMKHTIVGDVANELKISKKTIYKYFSGGKVDALYYFFRRIAIDFTKNLRFPDNITDPLERIIYIVKMIIEITKPYVIDNVADDSGFIVEIHIVGRAFRESIIPILQKIIEDGVGMGKFKLNMNIEILMSFIYGIIIESVPHIREDPEIKITRDIIKAITLLLNAEKK
jgi:AcrR family transcriptional regulator